jgi:site-specific DNA-cytosine methylase
VDLHSFRVLSLCSGAGGLELGLRLAVPAARTVCYVEREAYACAVLAARMEEKALDAAPVWSDVATFDGTAWRGRVDCITGGYPCQPFSVAGRQRGSDDPRHLWPHVARIVREVEPAWCCFENVANHLNLGYREVRRELEEMGYRVAEGLFTAAEVGASHKRQRLFILAHAERAEWRAFGAGSDGAGERADGDRQAHGGAGESGAVLAHAGRAGSSPTWPGEPHAERPHHPAGASGRCMAPSRCACGAHRPHATGKTAPVRRRMCRRTGSSGGKQPVGLLPALDPENSTPGEKSSPSPRRLNPLFVEWLMGWPIAWTDCDSAAMEWCRWRQRMRLELSRLDSEVTDE